MEKFKVIREHEGDKPYFVGGTREADEADVRHLIGKCLEKVAAPTKNKTAKPLKNKAG
tara:strand:+ start:3117 stop:3290 length:174 start_codon:yes stop_codon:yes gene_type:complete